MKVKNMAKRTVWMFCWKVSVLLAVFCIFSLGVKRTIYAAEFNIPAGDVEALINAIEQANANDVEDTINLESGTYTLTDVNNDTNGPNGLPSITSQIIITDADANNTIIERDEGAPPFRIVYIAATGILKLEGVTITGGEVRASPGGGILNEDGSLTLVDSTVINNRTGRFGANGGGIAIFSDAVVALINSVISGNSGSAGGGIRCFGDGRLTIIDSTISGNEARDQGGGGFRWFQFQFYDSYN